MERWRDGGVEGFRPMDGEPKRIFNKFFEKLGKGGFGEG